jgi:hypothetical protein
MKPSLADFDAASCRWHGTHDAISYELSWHGASEYQPQGIWCWYILLTSEQFYPEDWVKLRLERQDREYAGNWRRYWGYETFPDLDPHGGWTFGEMETYLGADGKEHEKVKVGCDYAHSWDRDGGYWEGKSDLERDVKHSIDLLVKMFPDRRERCAYSGQWGDTADFYTAINGARIHKTQEQKFSATEWPTWLPATSSSSEAKLSGSSHNPSGAK